MIAFGRIAFGRTREEISAFDHIYGTPRNIELTRDADFSDLSPELLAAVDIEAVRAAARNHNQRMSRLKQEARSSSGLGLTYKDGKLSEIQVSRGARGTHIAGKGFFGETPRAFLAALERENGEPALVKGPDCLFRNINLCAWAAFEVLPFGRVRFLQEEDEEDEAQDKSILLSSEPLERDDLSDYRPISFFG